MVFRVAFVSGVTPAKWFRVWAERFPGDPIEALPVESVPTGSDDALRMLADGLADVAFVRLPVPGDGVHAIPLYTEQPVVVVPKDHEVSTVETTSLDELTELGRVDEEAGRPGLRMLSVAPGPTGGADAMELVAAGVGLLVVPQAVARLFARKDVVARPVEGAEETRVALAWPADLDEEQDARVQEFVGVVRGRTANSSRMTAAETAELRAQKPTAKAKAKAAEARAAEARKHPQKKKGAAKPIAGRTRAPGRRRGSR